MAMKLLIIPLFAILTIATCKPVTDKTELPHSREFYAGYIKAITDNFDQLFETDRQVRSTKDEDDKPKEEKIVNQKIRKRSLTSLETKNDVDDPENAADSIASIRRPDVEAAKRTIKKILSKKAEKRSWSDMFRVPFMDADIKFVDDSSNDFDYENFDIRGHVYEPKKAVPIHQPEPTYFGFHMLPSQPIFKLKNPDLFTANPFPETIGVYSQNGLMMTPLPIQATFLFNPPERPLFSPLSGETRNFIQRREKETNNRGCTCQCQITEQAVVKSTADAVGNNTATLGLESAAANQATTREANAQPNSNSNNNNNNNNCCCSNNNSGGGSSSNNNNNCCCCCPCCCCCNNNNNNGGGSSNNNNEQCCCCCCQPCCCQCCHHHCCCCEPCCHQCCCCQPCCNHCCQPCCNQCCCQQHCCCHHHVHDCCCCNHDVHHHDCCHEHHCEHCCPTYHHKKVVHCHCHSYPPCCHKSQCHESHCCHFNHCNHHCCYNDHCHHGNHYGDHGGYGGSGYLIGRVPLQFHLEE